MSSRGSDIPRRTDRELAPSLSDSNAMLYWTAGGKLQWLWDSLLAAASDGGPHHRAVEGWDEPSGQLAAALWALQLVEGGSSDGVFAGAVGEGCVRGGEKASL